MRGLIIVVLVAALVGNIGSSLNSVSTVFTMDIYIRKYHPDATVREIIRVGRFITVAGAIVSVLITLAIDNIKGLNLFDVFQSVLGFLAPPMSVAFLLGVLWEGTTARAINGVLTLGTLFSVAIGVLFLWVFPASKYPAWPHFLLLSFYIFVLITLAAVLVSKTGAAPALPAIATAKPTRRVKGLWTVLTIVMIILYIIFNGYSAKAQSGITPGTASAAWVAYPGDYEIWLSNQVQNRRTERGTFFPPFWKLDNHYVLIDFRKEIDLPGNDNIEIKAQGRYNVKLDGKMLSGEPHNIRLVKGLHTLELKVYNQSTPPALWVKGRYLQTGSSWDVTYEDKEWIDATGKASDKSGTVWLPAEPLPGNDPAHWRLPTERHHAAQTTRTGNSLLIDFGKESFGFIKLHGLKGRGKLDLYYGESREEALSADSCEVLDRLDIDEGQPIDSTLEGSRALRYVNIQWTGDIHIDSASLLFEYTPLANKGSFRCSDPSINRIWDIAAYTFHLNTREFFIDGIKRDRWVWSGDAYQSYLMNYYLFFDSATVTRTLWALRGKDPVTSHINTIMDYSFYWFLGIYDYYRYTGDHEFLASCYPRMVTLMNWIQSRANKDGWLEGQPGDWLFIDWADGLSKKGELSFEQLLYLRSLQTMAVCAGIISRNLEAQEYARHAEDLRKKFFADFWDPHRQAFVHSNIDGKQSDKITRYTNMFAIFFDCLDSAQKQAVKRNVLLNDSIQKITTPYMHFYELEALCAMGEQKHVLKEINDYWGGMLANGATSFWEKYDPNEKGAQHYAMYGRPFGRSLCHAWGASPLYLLGKYFLGVRPLTAGYATYEVEPHLGGLQWMKGEVPTPHGNIKVSCSRNQVKIHTAGGRGTLRLKSREITLEPYKDYTINNEALD